MVILSVWQIEGFAQWVFVLVIGGFFSMLVWFLRKYIISNDKKHESNVKAVNDVVVTVKEHMSAQEPRDENFQKSIKVLCDKVEKSAEKLSVHGEEISSIKTKIGLK